MRKLIFALILMTAIYTSCEKEQDLFLIGKHNVGLLTDSTQVRDLKRIFNADSIVKFKEDDGFIGTINNIDVFEKGGAKLLVISPKEALDSTATFSTVRIIDPRYKTEKNISTLSTFKEINDAYKISKIDNLINTIVVSVNEIDASFTIDKKELPSNMRFDPNMVIDAVQIPDEAKVKYFMLHW